MGLAHLVAWCQCGFHVVKPCLLACFSKTFRQWKFTMPSCYNVCAGRTLCYACGQGRAACCSTVVIQTHLKLVACVHRCVAQDLQEKPRQKCYKT